MRPSAAINPYLIHDIVLVQPAALDRYQEPTGPATTETVRGRFQYERHRVFGTNGEEVLCEGLAFFKADAPVTFQTQVRFEARDWKVIKIDRLQGWRQSHLEVYVV